MSRVGRKKNERDEIEELLRVAEDEVLLKVNTGAHQIRSTSAPIDADLARRFDALRSPSAPAGTAKVPFPPRKEMVGSVIDKEEEELRKIIGDDLSARFAALKASSSGFREHPGRLDGDNDAGDDTDDDDRDEVSRSEVDKVIQWAKDAARLDPSRSDDDDDDDFYEDYTKQGNKSERKVKS